MELTSSRRTLKLNDGWRFRAGDVPAPIANKHLAAYMANKAGYARGAARGNYDDSDWPTVCVPHDWSVDGPVDPSHHVNSGFLPRGVGWYRRTFKLDEADRGQVLRLHFDAIASHAQVFVNGHLLSRSFNGYLPVVVDITDVATYGDELNTVAVRVDATPMEGWWYEGAGIYRNVWLTKRAAVHLVDDSLRVVASPTENGRWRMFVMGEIANASDSRMDIQALCRFNNPQGEQVTKVSIDCFVPRHGSSSFMHEITVTDPQLWDLETPYLYRLECNLLRATYSVDDQSIQFGFRTTRFVGSASADRAAAPTSKPSAEVDPTGFYLNGQRILLKGTCYHQDHAGLGVALPDSIHRFRVQRLKDMGTNAIRIGHHPPDPALLEACDELGMLVIDENRTFGSNPEQLGQLRQMVRRDWNHPSVILWSICNEEAIQSTPVARNIAETMVREVKRLDHTRLVTAAISGGVLNDNAMSETIDVMSINYSFPTLDPFHAKWPRKPVLSSETGCTLSTRGVYKTDAAEFQFASYDEDHAPWGSSARQAWREISSRPWMAGLFVWTGFDYRGEPSPHEWPSVTSHWGLMDLCGFEKDAFWRHKAYFSSEPVLHLLPHWNWADPAGATYMSPAGSPQTPESEAGDIDVAPTKIIRVQTLTNCDEAELFLNGRSLGRKPVDPIEMAEWQVPFEPGELKAVGCRGGVEILTTAHVTTGPATAIGLEVHPSCDQAFIADGEAAWPITIFATDAAGRRVPTADAPLTITVDGPAKLLGVGNGDPNDHSPNRGPSLPLFNGLAQAIVQSTTTTGRVNVNIRVISPGLTDGLLSFDLAVVKPRPSVPPATRRHFLNDWLMGPITPTPPDVTTTAVGTDMNTWERIKAGGPQPAWSTASGYAVYRATLKPPKAMATMMGRLVFSKIEGEAELFVDGVKQPAGDVNLTPRTTSMEIVIRLKGLTPTAGINGPVELLVPSRLVGEG